MAFRVVGCETVDYSSEPHYTGGEFDYQIIKTTYLMTFECDTELDLPTPIGSYETETVHGTINYAMGSSAHCIGSNKAYMINSQGTWVEQNEAARSDVYTRGEVNDILQDMADSQTNIDLAQDEDINANTDAIKALVNNPEPKNLLNLLSATTQTVNGITFTVNSDYSITFSGNNNTGNAAFFSVPVTIPPGSYYFTGMTETGGSGSGLYRLELRSPTATGTVNLVNDSTTPTAWGPTTTYTGYFNIRVANGTNIDPLEPKTVYPMISLRWKYNISNAFVPYSPSNMELYNLIKSYHP